ncbi:hypothetical protein ACFZC5_01925 [Nocardia gamkensis]|uniref:hypothetical protein n=1 Tax=Nocardia gamkensis TaxID=352869 RepID=UPI0036E8A55D
MADSALSAQRRTALTHPAHDEFRFATAYPRVADYWAAAGRLPGTGDDIADAHADDALFLCWPPGWENPMASTTLTAYQDAGGALLIYIGEPRGGRTADSAFFDALEAGWTLLDQDPGYVSWWNLDDRAQCWQRR